MKKETLKIKVNQTNLPNPMHLSAQQTYKAQVFKPKKGKGSYSRKNKYNITKETDQYNNK